MTRITITMQVKPKTFQVRPALALDLDGTVRRSKSGKTFIDGPDDIELMPGIEELIMAYRAKQYLIIGVTNQGGVAHGIKTERQNDAEIEATEQLFEDNPFHLIMSCFHMPSGKVEPYNHRSLCRKPQIGLLVLAEQEAWRAGYIIDWDKSLMVGDRPEDMQCAASAGIDFQYIDDFLKTDLTNGN